MNQTLKKSKYEWDANDYANYSDVQQKWAKELIGKLCLTGNESLLDIGCGDGKVTAEIASFLSEGTVVGIDNSAEMISLAKKQFPSSKYNNLSFSLYDAKALPFSQEFSAVFSNAVLHWIIDHQPVLKGVVQALKPNGQFIAQMGGKGNAKQVIATLSKIMAKDSWKQCFKSFSFPYAFYSPEEYEPWLQKAGFDIDFIELKPKDMVHENQDKFIGWFRTTWLPFTQCIPINLRDKFIDLVADEYFNSNPPDQEGRVHTQMTRLEFMAKKQPKRAEQIT